MSRIISIQNSGESLEKCISLFYTAKKSEESFYSDNQFYVYYGHNLPKKDSNVMPHGTVGFYEEYFSKYSWCPIKSDNDLLGRREMLLKEMNENRLLSRRNVDTLCKNDYKYLKFIKNVPMKILFPKFILHLEKSVKSIFPNTKFKEVFLEENYMQYFSSLPEKKDAYSIYALNINGTISHYYLNDFGTDMYYRNLFHMFKDLSQKPVLSGNSAFFLAEIGDITKNMECYIGYRKHSREKRMNREFALAELLKNNESKIEPKNYIFSQYFDKFYMCKNYSAEKLANDVIANVYEDFINEYNIF